MYSKPLTYYEKELFIILDDLQKGEIRIMDAIRKIKKENANSGYPLLGEVADEMNKAISQFPTLHSLHEGYAIMLEEVDELWEHVKTNQKRRDKEAIKKECIQIAAMALRIILDCGDMEN